MRLFRVDDGPGSAKKWRFMERFEVPSLERPLEAHFVRYRLIQTPWFGVYVHRFDNPDVRTFHDHPWNFVSIVLRGGYTEARCDQLGECDPRTYFVGSVNRKRAKQLHYIKKLLRTPTWTLIFTGRRQRVWGYVDDDGTWTRFDQHANARKFDQAMEVRKAAQC